MATNERFTDQPQMVSTEAHFDDDYWRGHADAVAGKPRDSNGTGQYHRGFEDGLKVKKK